MISWMYATKCLKATLTRVNLEEKATVATYKAPPNYGGFKDVFPSKLNGMTSTIQWT